MSKEKVTLRLPEGLRQKIERIKDREEFDHESEATREVLRRGIEHSHDDPPGEQLGQLMTGVAAVGAVVASVGAGVGQAWALSLVLPFTLTTIICSLLWASVRVLAGRDLV